MNKKTYIFKPYLFKIGTGLISTEKNNKYKVYLSRRLTKGDLEYYDSSSEFYKKVSEDFSKNDDFYYLCNLYNRTITSVNEVDNLESEITYEKLKNIPASAFIFSEYDCPKSCYLKRDYNYVSYPYQVDKLNYYNYTDAKKTELELEKVKENKSLEDQIKYEMGNYEETTDEINKGDDDNTFVMKFDKENATEDDIKRLQEILDSSKTGEWTDALNTKYETYKRSISADVAYMILSGGISSPYYIPYENETRCVPYLDGNFNPEYWETNYGFEGSYDSVEYDTYSIPQQTLEEKQVQMSFDDISGADVKGCMLTVAALMIVVDNTPAVYIELPLAIKNNFTTVNIRWSSNGIIQGV